MNTFPRANKTALLRKITSLAMIVLFVSFSISIWKMILANGMLLLLVLGTFVVVLARNLDILFGKPALKLDEFGISQGGYLWPMDNWKLEWSAITKARLFGGENPTLIVLDTPLATRMVTDFESFEQIVQMVYTELEKRGCPIEKNS